MSARWRRAETRHRVAVAWRWQRHATQVPYNWRSGDRQLHGRVKNRVVCVRVATQQMATGRSHKNTSSRVGLPTAGWQRRHCGSSTMLLTTLCRQQRRRSMPSRCAVSGSPPGEVMSCRSVTPYPLRSPPPRAGLARTHDRAFDAKREDNTGVGPCVSVRAHACVLRSRGGGQATLCRWLTDPCTGMARCSASRGAAQRVPARTRRRLVGRREDRTVRGPRPRRTRWRSRGAGCTPRAMRA